MHAKGSSAGPMQLTHCDTVTAAGTGTGSLGTSPLAGRGPLASIIDME